MKPTFDTEMSVLNRPKITRRRAIAMLAGAATTGTAAVALGSEAASAEIAFGELAVSDGTLKAENPAPTPIVDVEARLAYTVDSVSEYNVVLEAGESHDSREMLEFVNQDTAVTDGEFTESLTAPVTDLPAFEAADFEPAAEASVTEEIAVALVLSVMDGGDTKATAEVTDTATVTVTNTAVNIELQAGGEGEIRFET